MKRATTTVTLTSVPVASMSIEVYRNCCGWIFTKK